MACDGHADYVVLRVELSSDEFDALRIPCSATVRALQTEPRLVRSQQRTACNSTHVPSRGLTLAATIIAHMHAHTCTGTVYFSLRRSLIKKTTVTVTGAVSVVTIKKTTVRVVITFAAG